MMIVVLITILTSIVYLPDVLFNCFIYIPAKLSHGIICANSTSDYQAIVNFHKKKPILKSALIERFIYKTLFIL